MIIYFGLETRFDSMEHSFFMVSKSFLTRISLILAFFFTLTGCGNIINSFSSNDDAQAYEATTSENNEYTMDHNEAYSDVISELEAAYGKADIDYALSGAGALDTVFITGCIFMLVDFDCDGVEELMAVCYSPENLRTPYTNNYRINIYTHSRDGVSLLFYRQGLSGGKTDDLNDIMPHLTLATYDHKTYLLVQGKKTLFHQSTQYYGKVGSEVKAITTIQNVETDNISDSKVYKYYAFGNNRRDLESIVCESEKTKERIVN